MRTSLIALLGFGLVCSVAGPAAAGEKHKKGHEEEQVIEWAKLPAPVQKAAEAEMGGAKATKVERESRAGVVVYEVKFEKGGAVHEFKLAEDGAIMERETKIAVADLPKAVAEQVKRAYPKAKVVKAELVELRIYEVKIEEGSRQEPAKGRR